MPMPPFIIPAMAGLVAAPSGPPTLDGSASATTGTVTLTTSQSNDLIIVDAQANSQPITGVTATGLIFSRRATVTNVGGPYYMDRWFAVAASPLAAVTITVTAPGAGYIGAIAYGINGANTSSPWDAGGPVTGPGPDPGSITTHVANAMVLAGFRFSAPTLSPGSGFTAIQNVSYQMSEYLVATTPQTVSCAASPVGYSNGFILDAVHS